MPPFSVRARWHEADDSSALIQCRFVCFPHPYPNFRVGWVHKSNFSGPTLFKPIEQLREVSLAYFVKIGRAYVERDLEHFPQDFHEPLWRSPLVRFLREMNRQFVVAFRGECFFRAQCCFLRYVFHNIAKIRKSQLVSVDYLMSFFNTAKTNLTTYSNSHRACVIIYRNAKISGFGALFSLELPLN